MTVQKYLPWQSNNEDIIDFMRRIPPENSYLRIPITLKYFLNRKDAHSVVIQEIEDDAKEIVSVLPCVPVHEIKKHLLALGNMHNRKEIVLRILLNGREDLQFILDQMNNLYHRKRTTTMKNEEFNTNANKIRKVDEQSDNKMFDGCILSPLYNVLEMSTIPVATEINQKSTFESEIKLPLNKKKVVQPARFIICNNAIKNVSHLQQSVLPMAEKVPVLPQSTVTMTEQTSQILSSIQHTNSEVSSQHSTLPLPSHLTTVSQETSVGQELNNLPDKRSKHVDTDFLSSANSAKSVTSNEKLNDLINLVKNEFEPDVPITEEKKRNCDEHLVFRLIEMFTETCPEYIRGICENKKWCDFDELVTVILENENHPKRQKRSPSPIEVDPEEQFETVKALLPDADPIYLRMKCDMLEYNPEELNEFIIQASEKKNYPTIKDYLRNQQLSAQSKQYTTEFCIQNFVALFPEPHITFNDPKRVIDLDNYSKLYIKQYFENKFDRLPKRAIFNILVESNFKILQTNDKLTVIKDSSLKMKSRRKHVFLNHTMNNILVLQEFAFLDHRDEIEDFLVTKQKKEEDEKEYVKNNGLMNTCQCCFDDEVMPKDTFFCPKNCLFCGNCIRRSCEISFGEGKLNFSCLNNCAEEFSLQTLKNILPPKMFSKIAQKKMIVEIKAAGIEGLEMCPFCDFASIPNETDRIFKCFNPDCMKESCRNCKEPNHIPLHCDEIEKDENVKARTFIENEMTEALLCKCFKCGTSFFKEEGCNKMTCTCGAQMCYVCKKPVKDYTHFNGIGGHQYHLCPLYSDNNNLNKQKVLNAVEKAKAQIDQTKLKVDPTDNVQYYYENRALQLPQEPHLNLLMNIEMRRQTLFRRGRNRHHH